MSMLKTLLKDLATTFPDAFYGKAATFSIFPCVTYNVVNSDTTTVNSYSNNSEQFLVQFGIYDNNEDCEDLIDEQEDTEEILTTAVGLSSNNFFRVEKVGSIGPRYLENQKYWQILDTYQITLCEEKQ